MSTGGTISTDDVFVNCPFDADYEPVFRALLFTIFACEFRPRTALEVDDSSQSRIDKLYAIIEQCRFGIHDLSRTELDAASQLPRFNMPLELGIFLGAKRFGAKLQKQKRCLVLDIERFRYQRFISDLAGADIRAHGGQVDQAITRARDWLGNASRRKLPSAGRLITLHNRFLVDLPAIAAEAEFDVNDLPYADFERFVVEWLVSARP